MAGLLDIAGMEIELAKMIGRKVDLRTPAELSRYFRDDVLEKARAVTGVGRAEKVHLFSQNQFTP